MILVTGGAGFIGANFVLDWLDCSDEPIINLDKQGNPQPPKIKIETTVACDKCGSKMILRDSKRGPFLGCSGYPKCKNTSEVPAKLMEDLGLGANANGKKDEPVKPLVEDAGE